MSDEHWYALITPHGTVDMFLLGDDAHAGILRRNMPRGWSLELVDHPELVARLDASGDQDEIAGVPIESLAHEACMNSGCGLN